MTKALNQVGQSGPDILVIQVIYLMLWAEQLQNSHEETKVLSSHLSPHPPSLTNVTIYITLFCCHIPE